MTTINTDVQPIKKTIKVMGVKSFRIFDFHIFDEFQSKIMNPQPDSDSDGGASFPKREPREFIIQVFGINEAGKTVCLYITDYKPFFYAKAGDNWTTSDARMLQADIKNKLGYHGKSLITVDLEEHKQLYGFSAGKKHKFVKFIFENSAAMNKTKNLWYGEHNGIRVRKPYRFNNTILELYESNIPPLLRYFHIHNISPSGWVQVHTTKSKQPIQKTTTCDFEYICKAEYVLPMNKKETLVPYKICSFDIEASSSHGDFPVPIKTYKRLATNIVDVFLNHEITNSLEVVEKCLYTAFGHDSYPDIDIVYPKQMPSKKDLDKMVRVFTRTSIRDAKQMTNEETRKILTIDSMFEAQYKSSQSASMTATDDCDDDGEGADVAENNVSDIDEPDGEEEENQAPKAIKKSWPPRTPQKKIDDKITILDILQSGEYTREEKIQHTNETLSTIFPPLEGDKVTFIGSTFMRYGETQPYMNHCLVLGTCDDVDGAVIETTSTESELLLKWTELIQKENPDIIIGYNIFGFDYEFMFRRAQENHCDPNFLMLSRKSGEVCGKIVGGQYEIENTKVALASGEYDLRYYKTIGRLQIDMYTYFRRDYNLASYKLDDVAGQFISDDIKKITLETNPDHGEVTYLYSQNLAGLHTNDFIHIEISGFTSDYYQDGKKFRVVDIIKGMESEGKIYNTIVIQDHHNIPIDKYSIKWGMAKDDVSPQDIFRLANGSSSDRAIVAKYCIQDCNLVHHLMNKIDVITGYIEMSRICSVPISFLVFRGQGIKLTSYVAKKCREKGTLMPDLEKTFKSDGYEGAIVLPPKCSMYMDNPVACVDYSSLYPSSMISNNLSHDSKVWTREYDLEGKLVRSWGDTKYDNLPGYQYVDIEFDTFRFVRKTPTSRAEKVKSGTKICRWAQLPDNQKSIMPAILEELLKARSDTRKMIKTEKDPFMQNILDKRQLGYKVTANSLYGQCGARTSTFYEQDVAASTTATGRMMITYARRIIEEVYGGLEYETESHGTVLTKAEYVYGDTDSVFFTFNLEDPKTGEKIRGKKALEITIEIAQDAAKLCTDYLKPPMALAYEKTLMPFILLAKKRYVGMLYEEDPNKGKLKYMGLSLKRRDSCDYLKDVYGGILTILMKENNVQKATQYLDQALNDLIQGKVPMDKLLLTRALRSDYKNPKSIAHKVLADRIAQRDPGNKPKSGDRIKFVFIQTPGSSKKTLLGDRVETPEFILQNKLKIDYNYYITNQLMKPIQQLFGLALEQIWESQRKLSAIKAYKKDIDKLRQDNPDHETFTKKKEKYCSEKVKVLLFDKVLQKISNEKNKLSAITNFFMIS